MKKHPKLLYALMLISMVISAAASFTIFRNQQPAAEIQKPFVKPVISDGFDQISQTATNIGQIIQLQNQIDSLSKKQQLNRQESLVLEKDFDQLRQLQKQQP